MKNDENINKILFMNFVNINKTPINALRKRDKQMQQLEQDIIRYLWEVFLAFYNIPVEIRKKLFQIIMYNLIVVMNCVYI